MLSAQIQDAFARLTKWFAEQPQVEALAAARWRTKESIDDALPDDARSAVIVLRDALPSMSQSEAHRTALSKLFAEAAGTVLFAWCSAVVSRADVQLVGLLQAAAQQKKWAASAVVAARARVVHGPLLDALSCAPLLGAGAQLTSTENTEARARLEILLWEAGASAVEVPAIGRWLWGSQETFDAMIQTPAKGALRGRVLAARTLEVGAGGMPQTVDPSLIGLTLQVLQPLFLHPEPLVWVHAARAFGRLTKAVEQLEGTIIDWAFGDSKLLRQRALTSFASLPAPRLKFYNSQITEVLDAPEEEAWALAALAAGTPYLFFERRDLWDRLSTRVLRGDGGATTARALARGLAAIWRRGGRPRGIEVPLRALRERARRARPESIDDSRRWLEVLTVTDGIDEAERDPLDLETGLENLMRVAAQYEDEEADARASRFAVSLAGTMREARRIALSTGPLRQRAAAMNALEGCARSCALRVWGPLLVTHGTDDAIPEPELNEAWEFISRAPSEILDLVKERRQIEGNALDSDVPLESLAIRMGGYALDACGEDSDLGPGRGPTAHATCLWLRKIQGLADGSREFPPNLKNTLSTIFWRLVDTTQGTALGEVDDKRWLGPFAAWWALVIDRPAMLTQLATALPMISEEALAHVCNGAEKLRMTVASGVANGDWGSDAEKNLKQLHAQDTALAHSLSYLSQALWAFSEAAGPRLNLETLCQDLVLAGDRLQEVLANPVRALHPVSEFDLEDSFAPEATEASTRNATLVARAIRSREISMLEVWFASLGPVASGLLEAAIQAAIKRTPQPPPVRKKDPMFIEGYELVRPLGEGGIGSVWLVRKPGADRLFVLKIPKADALASATEKEREAILASFVEEARALAGLYHPNVANIIDRGVSGDAPYLVLEYLIGADLKQYATAKLMTLPEVKPVVLGSCAGLAALHNAGLVHRDIKPANLWLRLPLAGGEKFENDKHRDPATTPPLATVVIDFGMVRSIRIAAEVGGRFVAGTAGYIAPEQVLDPVELDPRADVYSLAGTIYNVMTNRAFFDDIDNQRDRIIAHMRRDPFENAERLRVFPQAVAKLMRAATAWDPKDRPWPLEFGKLFAAAI